MLATNASPANPEFLALEPRLGTITRAEPLGSNASCWRIVAGGRPLVAKRMPLTRPAHELVAIWSALGPDSCPPLVAQFDEPNAWWAIFRWQDGAAQRGWSAPLIEYLPRLWASPVQGSVALLDEWIDRLADFRYGDAPADLLRRRLFEHRPSSALVLAHGDFAPQNLLVTPTGPQLIDWEQCGHAPAGFDAGWLAALVRARLVEGEDNDVLATQLARLGVDTDELRWFEGLGLLRLLYRIRSTTLSANARAVGATRVRAAILHHLE